MRGWFQGHEEHAAQQDRWSGREAAVSVSNSSLLSGGCLPPLTSSVEPHEHVIANSFRL